MNKSNIFFRTQWWCGHTDIIRNILDRVSCRAGITELEVVIQTRWARRPTVLFSTLPHLLAVLCPIQLNAVRKNFVQIHNYVIPFVLLPTPKPLSLSRYTSPLKDPDHLPPFINNLGLRRCCARQYWFPFIFFFTFCKDSRSYFMLITQEFRNSKTLNIVK